MSLLLIGISGDEGRALVERLVAQSDEVRVIEDDPVDASEWTSLGAHVAHGSATDSDLIERAAQNVRTVVVMEERGRDLQAVIGAVLQGAPGAARREEDLRVVACAPDPAPTAELLSAAGVDHVVLGTGDRRGRLRIGGGGRIRAGALAEAIDAADDLAGNPRTSLDLTDPSAWEQLRLLPPDRPAEGRRQR
ncbi:MAG: NAD-binding protein [Actinomycetota bacterium]